MSQPIKFTCDYDKFSTSTDNEWSVKRREKRDFQKKGMLIDVEAG